MTERLFIAIIHAEDEIAIAEVVNETITDPSNETAERLAGIVFRAIAKEQVEQGITTPDPDLN